MVRLDSLADLVGVLGSRGRATMAIEHAHMHRVDHGRAPAMPEAFDPSRVIHAAASAA